MDSSTFVDPRRAPLDVGAKVPDPVVWLVGSEVGRQFRRRSWSLPLRRISCDSLCMRMTIEIDLDLLEEAVRVTGAPTKSVAVRLGLKALVEEAARRRLVAL